MTQKAQTQPFFVVFLFLFHKYSKIISAYKNVWVHLMETNEMDKNAILIPVSQVITALQTCESTSEVVRKTAYFE